MKLNLKTIILDQSTQCRDVMRQETIDEYAERMRAGDKFPPIDVFGTPEKSWIADGWHRIMAAREIGADSIETTIHHGGRTEAVKFALGANAVHGLRRSNADKRRAVSVALAEFGGMSCRAVAEMCGVGNDLVQRIKPEVTDSVTSPIVTGRDGKTYPATRQPTAPAESKSTLDGRTEWCDDTKETEPETKEKTKIPEYMPSDGVAYAHMAIANLEKIQPKDKERTKAWQIVREWLNINE